MKCVKVPLKNAEETKLKLIEEKALSREYRPLIEKDHIYFGVTKNVKGFDIVEKDLPESNREDLDISSFDQVGDIVIVAENVDNNVANKLIKRNNVNVVLRKSGIHKGEFRTQDLEWVAGEKRKETIYKENGVQMKLNVETSYFSPRLGTERKRIANMVQPGEKVLVLFSGVGPYLLVIAKHSEAELIVGVEKNPQAHRYAMFNCRKRDNIELFNLDANDFNFKTKFDRILMPLPKSAEDFLPVALRHSKKGTIIHFYDFLPESDIPEASLDKIRKHKKNFEVLSVNKCGQYSPGKYRICIDFRV